jgi:hypothetical protein
MAGSTEGFTIPGLTAAGTLATAQYKFVKTASTANQVIVGTSATSKVLGVLQNDPADGEEASVQFAGVARVLSEASVTYGSFVTCSTTGRAKSTTTVDNLVLGKALEAGNAGDIIKVLIGFQFLYATT